VRVIAWCSIAIALTGCAQLPSTGDGVVALEVTPPATLTLAAGDSVQLIAAARDSQGEEITADIRWATPDTTLTVDSITGLVVAIDSSGTGRVQAAIGNLHSSFLTFQLTPQAGL
jgi:hypothetical protein